jgi:carbon-monoxide dehydrogenase medium subunit
MRALEAEKLLVGKKINEKTLVEAGKIAAGESQVRDSIRGKAWHRKEMVQVHVRRMGLQCLDIIRNNS